jgi:hypothetical protein
MLKLIILSVFIWLWITLFSVQASNRIKNPRSHRLPDSTRIPVQGLISRHGDIHSALDSIGRLFNCKVKVKHSAISTTMNARPVLSSLFSKSRNRQYVIRINNRQSFHGVSYDKIPEDARIGLWVHELMHIDDYQNRSVFGVIKRGWQYLSTSGKAKFEWEIDQKVIEAGYGYHLYCWINYVLHESDATEAYRKFKSSIYMNPEDVIERMYENALLSIPD